MESQPIQHTVPPQDAEEQSTITQLTMSIRSNPPSKGLFFKLNIRSNIFQEMDLSNNQFYELTRKGANYVIRFMPKKNWRSRKLRVVSGDSGLVIIPQEELGFQYQEPVSQKVKVIYTKDKMIFTLENDGLQRTNVEIIDVKKIETVADKIAAGFIDKSSWGVKMTDQVDEEIKKATDEYFRKKLEMIDAINNR